MNSMASRPLLEFLGLRPRPSYSEFRDRLTDRPESLEATCRRIMKYVSYIPDAGRTKNEWSLPERTWAARGGDCEDLAVLFHDLLQYARAVTTSFHVVFPRRPTAANGHVYLSGGDGSWIVSNGVWTPGSAFMPAFNVMMNSLGWCPEECFVMDIHPTAVQNLCRRS